MAVENEVKICMDSFDGIRDALIEINAKHMSTVDEKNVLFDNNAGDLKAEDVGLRLRCETDCVSGSIKSVLLTVKGPKMGGATKMRQEFEAYVSDFKRAKDMLNALGFKQALVYEKVRERWAVSGTGVCLDTLPFGSYVEIEGKEKYIVGVAKKLGFGKDDFITSNYFDLAKEKGVRGDIVFRS
ncbi:MAG: class IV adenylate cyclase [archaeon]